MNDITKLPKWAQSRITNAENSAESWRLRFAEAEAGDTDVFIRDYARGDIGLAPGSVISFKAEDGRFDVSLKEGQLEVTGVGAALSDQLKMLPRSTNIVLIALADWDE